MTAVRDIGIGSIDIDELEDTLLELKKLIHDWETQADNLEGVEYNEKNSAAFERTTDEIVNLLSDIQGLLNRENLQNNVSSKFWNVCDLLSSFEPETVSSSSFGELLKSVKSIPKMLKKFIAED